VTPRATQTFADFMAKIGALPRKPTGWKALFFPEAHELPGS
jgi:NitT/TauT family transport system substrate-binding protein